MRVSEVVGKPIVSADTGEKLGTVADLLVDSAAARVVGLVIRGGLLSAEHVLPYAVQPFSVPAHPADLASPMMRSRMRQTERI